MSAGDGVLHALIRCLQPARCEPLEKTQEWNGLEQNPRAFQGHLKLH